MALTLSSAPLTLHDLEIIFREKPLLQLALENLSLPHSPVIPANQPISTSAEAYLLAHSMGFAPIVPQEITRLTLALQLSALVSGDNPSIRPETLQRLLALYNREVWPVLQAQGLPASQLAQLCLPLLGVGKVNFQGYELNAADVLNIFSWEPLALSAAEVNILIRQNTYTLAHLAYNLLQLQPLILWLDYLIGVFEIIAVEQPPSLLTDKHNLTEALSATRQIIEKTLTLPAEKQNLAQVRDAVVHLLQSLVMVGSAVADLTAETFDNLGATAEPPATSSFGQASDLVQLLQKQLKLKSLHPTDTVILTKEFGILHHNWQEANLLTEQLIGLAFWSIAQVGKVFSLTPGNLTLSAYYHSVFFVPNDIVSDQLQKILEFTRITIPEPVT